MEISEAREVRVRQGETNFVFLADHSTGRLVVREEDDGDEVCAITVGNRQELDAFLTGLRRVLGVDENRQSARGRSERTPDSGSAAPEQHEGDRPRRDLPGSPDREAAIERARERNPQAFKSWSADEERRLAEAYEGGASIEQLARDHQRSPRAVDMRLQKLGLR